MCVHVFRERKREREREREGGGKEEVWFGLLWHLSNSQGHISRL